MISVEEESSNYLGFGLFFFLIVLIILLGSIFIFFNVRSKNTVASYEETEQIGDKLKKDKDKEFIYFKEEETISETLNILYKVPVINLKSEEANAINNELKAYTSGVKNTLQKGDLYQCYDEASDIYKTNYLDYAVYKYQEYVTLLMRESEYNCEVGFSPTNKVKSYTFNVFSGKVLSFQDLLQKYNTTLTKVIEQIRVKLNEDQTIIEEVPNIKIEETINQLKAQETYVFYIDEFGDLLLNYVVKTNSVDYNDIIIIK